MREELVHNLAAEACTQTVGCVQRGTEIASEYHFFVISGGPGAAEAAVASDVSGRLKKEAEFIALEFELARRQMDAPTACSRCGAGVVPVPVTEGSRVRIASGWSSLDGEAGMVASVDLARKLVAVRLEQYFMPVWWWMEELEKL